MKSAEIERLLPEVFRRTAQPGSPMAALLGVMEGMHEPDEAVLAGVDRFFSPYRAPDAFVPFLARWVDLDRLFQTIPGQEGHVGEFIDLGQLRELIASAAHLSQWRGTRKGLRAFLETATGMTGFRIEESPEIPFHLRIRMPSGAARYRPLVERIVELEKPAYVTWEAVEGDAG